MFWTLYSTGALMQLSDISMFLKTLSFYHHQFVLNTAWTAKGISNGVEGALALMRPQRGRYFSSGCGFTMTHSQSSGMLLVSPSRELVSRGARVSSTNARSKGIS
jgi:hypothetical protein